MFCCVFKIFLLFSRNATCYMASRVNGCVQLHVFSSSAKFIL